MKAHQILKDDLEPEGKEILRFIHPKSIHIGVGGNLVWSQCRTVIENEETTSYFGPALNFQANFQKGIRKNFFFESHFSAEKHFAVLNDPQNPYPDRPYYYLNPTRVMKLAAGIGYRWINNETYYNYLTISAGFVMNKFLGLSGSFGGGTSYSADYYYSYFAVSYIRPRPVPGIYLMLTKDLKLSKSLILSLGYRYDLGFIDGSFSSVSYTYFPATGYTDAEIFQNGTAQAFSVSLKYYFITKKYKYKYAGNSEMQ